VCVCVCVCVCDCVCVCVCVCVCGVCVLARQSLVCMYSCVGIHWYTYFREFTGSFLFFSEKFRCLKDL
jgi:hypothetical protein